MAMEKIDKITKVTGKIKGEELQPEPNKDYFQSLMDQKRIEKDATLVQEMGPQERSPSLMEEVSELNHKVNLAAQSTPKEIAEQADKLVAEIDGIRTKLEDKNLSLNAPVQTLLKRKLSHIDESLKVALDRAGLEYTAPENSPDFQRPVNRFLRFLTHGQDQLNHLADHIKAVGDRGGGMMQPEDLLLVQIKVNYIQQELELFTSMLNKALESTKTVLNVQV